MDTNKPLIVVFPYIAISEPLEIRGEILFPSNFRTIQQESIFDDDEWYHKSEKEQKNRIKAHLQQRLRYEQSFFDAAYKILDEIIKYFYWYSNEQIKDVTWCYLEENSSQKRRHIFRQRLEEIQKILGYLWCVPDSRPRFFSLYGNYDQLNYYSFEPEIAIWEGGVKCVRFSPTQSREEGKLKYVKGYRYYINQNYLGDVIEGCRLYPTSRGVLRREYTISRLLEGLNHGRIKSHVPLLFSLDYDNNAQLGLIFDSIEWYNRSCYADITADISLIYLAIAFENLLLPRRKGKREEIKLSKTQLLYESIRTIVGDFERLDQWVEQFYNARSRIVHEGQWSQLRFVVNDSQKKNTSNEYGYLIHYGWLIFRICLNSILAGIMHSNILDLQFRFFSNQERLESIKDVIENTNDPHETINLIIGNIRILSDRHMQDEQGVDIILLWTVAKALTELIRPLMNEVERQKYFSSVNLQSYHISYDDENEIIEYTKLVFENVDDGDLPEIVLNLAINDLESDSQPSLSKIRRNIKHILRRNNVSEELEIRLTNIIRLIELSFVRSQLQPLAMLSDDSTRVNISTRIPFSLIQGYARFVNEIVRQVESNTKLAMLQFKVHVK
ncbi:MAG: hypothetical protein AAF846_20045 [Chloroflexota bacterium]